VLPSNLLNSRYIHRTAWLFYLSTDVASAKYLLSAYSCLASVPLWAPHLHALDPETFLLLHLLTGPAISKTLKLTWLDAVEGK